MFKFSSLKKQKRNQTNQKKMFFAGLVYSNHSFLLNKLKQQNHIVVTENNGDVSWV